jgi:hypothetical protein
VSNRGDELRRAIRERMLYRVRRVRPSEIYLLQKAPLDRPWPEKAARLLEIGVLRVAPGARLVLTRRGERELRRHRA